jgi:hypothetical protein
MSDPSESPVRATGTAPMEPEESLKTTDYRNTPPLRGRNEGDDPPQGPNLITAFSIIGLALLAAIVAAALIVWPFYKAR